MLGLGSSITNFSFFEDPPFDLSTNADLKVWLKFNTDIVIATQDKVRDWLDQSGNDNHARELNTTFMPTTTGGYLIFDGANDQLTFLNSRSDNNFTAMVALDLTAGVTNNESVFGRDNNAWALKLYRGTQASKVGLRVNGNTPVHADVNLSGGDIPTVLMLLTTTYDGTTVEYRINKVSQGSANFTAGGNPFTLQNIGFGKSSDSNARLNGNIYEFAFYDSVLTGEDLTNAEDSIMIRTGIV